MFRSFRARHSLRRRFSVGLLAAIAPVMAAQGDIAWRTGRVATPIQAPQQAAATLAAQAGRHVVVQFASPVSPAQRTSLSNAGLNLLSYLGDNAFFAHVDANAIDAGALVRSGLVFAGHVQTNWKLHPTLLAGDIVKWSIVDNKNPHNPIVGAYIVFHDDVNLDDGVRLAEAFGAVVHRRLNGVNGLVIDLPFQLIPDLASEDGVLWIEPPLPLMSGTNNSNRARVGADTLQAAPYGLTGAGVATLIYDGGQVFAHGDFAGRLTVGASDTSGISTHATHVAGTVGGSGAANATYKGMAPGVQIVSYGFEQPGGLTPGFLYTDPGDLEADYGEAINVYNADISNNSIGSNVEPNGFDCTWQGDYGVCASVIDAVVRGSVSGGEPFRVVWAAGNERQGSRCDIEGFGDYYSTAPPAGAKNHITVGALNSNDDSVTSFTSWGPTDDGRLKPDISGPGCQSNDDLGVTSCSSSAGSYTTLCGTSMASPTVCGISALILEDYRVNYPDLPDFRNSTLKVFLAHTAVDIGNPGPDYQSGYGSVRAPAAVDFMRSGNFVEASVDHGDAYNVVVVVNPGDPELKITLAWDDPPGTPNVNPNLVNDLDLVVVSPSGTRYYPWTLNPAVPSAPAVQTQEDHLNNIEQVLVANPEAGGWTVEVRGTNVPGGGGSQPFSIGASPLLVNCADAGLASLSRGKYNCAATATLRVVDCGLNADDGAVETVLVTVRSNSQPGGLNVLLTETAAESAAFLGTVALSTSGGGGTLQVAEGDTVTLEYIDADDGEGGSNVLVTDTATVDCTAPAISNISLSELTTRSVKVNFTTNEPCVAVVRYGTDCGALTESASGGLGVSHSIRLSNLQHSTTYAFAIEVADEADNVVIDDNGGACHDFTTLVRPDFFTEQLSSNDVVGGFALFTPDGSSDYYSVCYMPLIGGLPTDPTGGTNLGLADDQPSSALSLSGGQTVSLYGVSYGSFYVGPNGYVTFTSGDSTYNESLASHFDRPRISGWFDDLNPSAAGSVSWKQTADRVAVTWLNVPEYNTSNQNTFQIEMYFDGRIQVSWLTMASQDGISGLSQGLGLDPDFEPTDLSATGACGPQPPIAVGVNTSTSPGVVATIALNATDDGLPDPPAALTYTIQSLPASGVLRDPAGGVIGAVPYTLLSGGNVVEYAPPAGLQGQQSFSYTADDGGSAPEGGQSNVAPVTVTIGGAGASHEFLVDDTDPGWTAQGQWAFGQPTGGGSHNFDPTGGFTGANVYGFNLSGDYPDNLSTTRYLISGAIDCSSLTNTTLTFYRWLGIESASFDHANVQVSLDGSNWTTIWEHTGPAISDASWLLQTFDISALADHEATVFLRWGLGPTDSSVTYPGWNLDDIVISGVVNADACPGDLDGDGTVSLTDLSILLGGYGASGVNPIDGDLDGDGDIDIADLSLLLSGFGANCP